MRFQVAVVSNRPAAQQSTLETWDFLDKPQKGKLRGLTILKVSDPLFIAAPIYTVSVITYCQIVQEAGSVGGPVDLLEHLQHHCRSLSTCAARQEFTRWGGPIYLHLE